MEHKKPRKPTAVKPAALPDVPASPRLVELIEAAETIFLAKGYHSATMNDVAKAAGMSKKTVYQLVHSKADLFVALLSHYQSLLSFPVEQPDWTIQQILVENLLCLAKFMLSPAQIAIVRLIMTEYTHSPDLCRVFHQRRVTKAKSRLEICLTEVAKRQGFVIEDPHEMAAMLFGMAMGEFHISVLVGYRSVPSKAVLERRIRQAVDIFLAGCAMQCPERQAPGAAA